MSHRRPNLTAMLSACMSIATILAIFAAILFAAFELMVEITTLLLAP
jgi:hypothetical protein